MRVVAFMCAMVFCVVGCVGGKDFGDSDSGSSDSGVADAYLLVYQPQDGGNDSAAAVDVMANAMKDVIAVDSRDARVETRCVPEYFDPETSHITYTDEPITSAMDEYCERTAPRWLLRPGTVLPQGPKCIPHNANAGMYAGFAHLTQTQCQFSWYNGVARGYFCWSNASDSHSCQLVYPYPKLP